VLVYTFAVRGIQLWSWRLRAGKGGSPPGSGVWYAMANFVLLGTLGLVVGDREKAEGQAGVRLGQTSPVCLIG
jgi:hypothetical protein